MLKSLLSKLKRNQSNQSQENPQKSNSLTTPPDINSAVTNIPFISQTSLTSSPDSHFPTVVDVSIAKLVVALQLGILIISFAFLFLVIFNIYLDRKLDDSKSKVDDLVTTVQDYKGTQDQAALLEKKLNFYKNTAASRSLMSTKTGYLFKNSLAGVTFTHLTIAQSKFLVQANVDSPFSFALLISQYVQEDFVSALVLKSANLDATTSTFDITMEGTFK